MHGVHWGAQMEKEKDFIIVFEEMDNFEKVLLKHELPLIEECFHDIIFEIFSHGKGGETE